MSLSPQTTKNENSVADASTGLTYGEMRRRFHKVADTLNIHHLPFEKYDGPSDLKGMKTHLNEHHVA